MFSHAGIRSVNMASDVHFEEEQAHRQTSGGRVGSNWRREKEAKQMLAISNLGTHTDFLLMSKPALQVAQGFASSDTITLVIQAS